METRQCLVRNLIIQIGNQHKLQFRDEAECGEKSETFELGKSGQYAITCIKVLNHSKSQIAHL